MNADEGGVPPWYIPGGEHLRPDPDAVTTITELLAAMRLYQVWAGNPSFRDLAAHCGHRVSASTFCDVLQRDALPRAGMVREFIGACGATDAYLERFDNAWRRLAGGRA